MNSRWLTIGIDAIKENERVDFKVSEVYIDVDRIKSDEEIDQGIFLDCWHVDK